MVRRRCAMLAGLLLVALACLGGCGGQVQKVADRNGSRGKTYQASFDFACVNNIDYMRANELSNYLEGYVEGSPVDPAMQALIEQTSFGSTLSLLASSGPEFKAAYTFKPVSTSNADTNGVTTFTFDAAALPKKAGVPNVSVTARITPVATSVERGDGALLDQAQTAQCRASTSFWPTQAPEVQSIVREAVREPSTDVEKVTALWRWVRDNIKYSGPQGSRWGTVKVLQQRFGRCWDFADVIVTLCRAVGVPTRQVAGWLVREAGGGGHVWAQAYLAGKGWISVDCTSDRLGSDTSYVPYLATCDGAMPILYARFPTFE